MIFGVVILIYLVCQEICKNADKKDVRRLGSTCGSAMKTTVEDKPTVSAQMGTMGNTETSEEVWESSCDADMNAQFPQTVSKETYMKALKTTLSPELATQSHYRTLGTTNPILNLLSGKTTEVTPPKFNQLPSPLPSFS